MNASVFDNYKKREVRVFISSTFRDMMDEREIIVKKVFPNLRNMFRDRGITITEVDLRWGVLEEEAQNGKVIEICLNEIDKSRPYFIGILGERYGWVPGIEEYQKHKKIIEDYPWVQDDINEGLSITEMEIQYGVLRNPGMVQRSAFFIRNDGRIKENFENADKQKRLKEKIFSTEGLFYSDYSSAQYLAEMITEHLINRINSDFPEDENNGDINAQLNFINSRGIAYIKNEDYYFVLDNHFENSNTPIVITGDRGIGKSSLLTNYLTEFAKKNKDYFYLFNFSEASIDSSDYIKVLQRFCEELSGNKIDLGTEFATDTFNGILSYFVKLLDETSPQKVLIVIDGIDELIDDEHSRLINWLPDSFPENVQVILSCGESVQLKRVKEKGYRIYDIEGFTSGFKKDFINCYFSFYSKKLPQEIIDQIITDEISDLPLTLQSMADELRQYGVHEGLKERVNFYLAAEGPVDYYDHVLTRLEEDFNTKEDSLVKDILSVMALFNSGVKENEIQQILNISPLSFSSVFNSVENNLLNKDGCFYFGNKYFREAVEKRYLSDKKVIDAIREKIISYLVTVVWTKREISEAAHQVTQLDDYDRLYELLSDITNLVYLQDADRYLLIKYWSLIKDKYSITAAYSDEKIKQHVEKMEGDSGFLITAYNVVAALLYDMGMYEESEPYFQTIYDLSLKYFEEGAEYTYSNLMRLINIKLKLNKTDDAGKSVAELFEFAGKYYEETDGKYIKGLYLVGKVLLAQKKFDDAIEAFHLAIQSLMEYYNNRSENEDRISLFHLDLLEDTLKCYLHMGLLDEAVTESDNILGLKIELYGGKSSEVADAYKSVAAVYAEVGRYEDASDLYMKSFEIRATLFGKQHPLANEILSEIKKLHTLKNDIKINK